MSRERFESSDDLEAETAVRAMLQEKWNCELASLPDHYRLDWAGFRDGKLVAFVEFKNRININTKTYPDIMLSYAKVEHGLRLSMIVGVPFLFVIQLNDGVFVSQFTGTDSLEGLSIRNTGRSGHPRDDQDMEPCLHIPVSRFKRVGNSILSPIFSQPTEALL